MKKIISLLLLTSLFSATVFAQQDTEGCKDSPMFPKRMPNYFISECKSNYGEADFNVGRRNNTQGRNIYFGSL